MENNTTTETSDRPLEVSPEQMLKNFIDSNIYANRHERRKIKKLYGIDIPSGNKPYVKNKQQ